MQREANALMNSLREFIDQPDYPTLVLGSNDVTVALPNRTLYEYDSQDELNYYLLFPGPCTDAGAYMDGIIEALEPQREAFNMELEARSLSPLPPWPIEVPDSRYPPVQRLRALVAYCGQHLPEPGAIVWGLLPQELNDFEGYRAMIAPLLAPNGVESWMDRHRFIVRDRDEPAVIIPQLHQAKNENVLVMELDFSNERVEQSLHEQALDRSLPKDDRMFAFFQLAALDFAFKRYPDALQKYGACFNYFDAQGNKAFASLCLKGAGDTALQGGKPQDALKFYQQSIAVSMDDKNPATLQQGLYSAGCTSLELGQNEDAEGYLTHADVLAGKLNNPNAKCDALEKLGQAKWRLGKVKEAADSWTAGKELAKQFAYEHRACSILDQLAAMYRVAGMHAEAVQSERERAGIASGDSAHGV